MNDGGPAFPGGVSGVCSPDDDAAPTQRGMTLRDYFAAKALQGFIAAAAFNQAAEDMMKKAGIKVKKSKETEAFIAMLSYDFADAMLAEREKR